MIGRFVRLFAITAATILAISGCGGGGVAVGSTAPGGGGGSRDPVQATVTIHWALRSRAVNVLGSALSAAITLQNTSLTTVAAKMEEDRQTAPAAYTANYTTTNTVTPGPYILSVVFHSGTGAQGEVVATAVASVLVNGKGQVTNATGGTLSVNAQSNLASVSIVSGQTIPIGTPTTLLVTGADIQGNIFPLTPGSVFWHVVGGGNYATLESNGSFLGVAKGVVTAYVIVDGIDSPQASFSVLPPSVTPRSLTLATNGLTQSPTTGLLYGSVPSTGGSYGNRIVEINPTTGKVTRSVFVGSEPSAMAFSADGTMLYAGLNGANAYAAVSVSATAFKLTGTYEIPRTGVYVSDIKVQPGTNNVVAVTTQDIGDTGNGGPIIFKNGQLLPTYPDGIYVGQPMVWPSAANIYTFDNTDTGFGLYQFAVNASGDTQGKQYQGLFSGFGTIIRQFGSRIYGSDGSVVNTSNLELAGRFDVQNGCDVVVDTTESKAAVASTVAEDATLYVNVFSTSSFVPVTEFTVPNVIAVYPNQPTTTSGMCRYGTHGLAFRSPTSVYFIDSAPGF